MSEDNILPEMPMTPELHSHLGSVEMFKAWQDRQENTDKQTALKNSLIWLGAALGAAVIFAFLSMR
jgi:hypothetical protein